MNTGTKKPANNGKTALVTGASGGIGYELARVFAREGYSLVLVARTEEKLNEIKDDFAKRWGTDVLALAKDLSQPNAPQELWSELREAGVAVDVLVNNAGFTVYGLFAKVEVERELGLLRVNIVALTHLTALFLPDMIERGWGKVLNLSSTAAFTPGPFMATYFASKAYVLSFSEALSVELEGTGVTVTALCPGPTQTGFAKRGDVESRAFSEAASAMIMDARTVARIGYRGLMRGQSLVIAGKHNWIQAQATRFIPRKLLARVVQKAQEPV